MTKSFRGHVDEIYDEIWSNLAKNGVSEARLEALRPVLANVALMQAKLEETSEEIETSSIVVEYDNGGGQRGIRENPLFRGYEALWKSYMVGVRTILDGLDAETAKATRQKATETRSVLEIVKARRAQ